MRNCLFVSGCLITSVLISLCLCEDNLKDERKRQTEERRRLRLSAGKETEASINTDDKFSGELEGDTKVVPSDRRTTGNKDGNRRRQKLQRRERLSALDQRNNEVEKNDLVGNNLSPTPPFVGDEFLLLNDYAELGKEAQCVDIPRNMSMCQAIGYTKMRLPNLLHHTSLNEVVHDSKSWIPLLRSSCHPDAELFLCALFSPVCLDQVIYPCRSLCEMVKSACEGLMIKHKYSWPEMLSCDRLPSDNDLCIVAQSGRNISGINIGSISSNSSSNSIVDKSSRGNSSSSSSSNANSSGSGNISSNISSNSTSSSSSYNSSIRTSSGVNKNTNFTVTAYNYTIRQEQNPESERDTDKLFDDDYGDHDTCSQCRPLEKFSELQSKYCTADFVVKMRPNEVLQIGTDLVITAHKKLKFLKEPEAGFTREWKKGARRAPGKADRDFYLSNAALCQCLGLSRFSKGGQYLLMGRLQRSVGHGAGTWRMLLSYVAEYQSPALKRALRGLIRNDRCATLDSNTLDHSSSSLPLSSSSASSSHSLSLPTSTASGEQKVVKIERRRKKLERKQKRIERKEKISKNGRKNTGNDLDNDDNGLKSGSDKRKMKRRQKKIDKKIKRNKSKTEKDILETNEQGLTPDNKKRIRQKKKQQQAMKRRERQLKKVQNNGLLEE